MTKLPIVGLLASRNRNDNYHYTVKVVRGVPKEARRGVTGFWAEYKVTRQRYESIVKQIKAMGGGWKIQAQSFIWRL